MTDARNLACDLYSLVHQAHLFRGCIVYHEAVQKHTRYWEIDTLRGLAIILMVLYHLRFDLSLLGFGWDLPVGGGWQVVVWMVAGLFLSLVGVSLWLARAKTDWQLIRRGGQILSLGLAISLVTYWFDPTSYVRFGILHLIGLSIILTVPFFRSWVATRVMLGLIWSVWAIISLITRFRLACDVCQPPPLVVEWLLMIVGFWPQWWQTLDYYPLLPWWGVVVAGVALGQFAYPADRHRFDLGPSRAGGWRVLALLGRHSLVIYLIHQPILVAILLLLKRI
jgi:uncharacterized membrane protein